MRPPDPIDILGRLAAVPLIVRAASMSLVGRAHRLRQRSDEDGAENRIGILERLSDGFFEHVEDRFRTRFARDADPPPDAA